MKTRFVPKPLAKQCIVITGASNGIGLATARMAARHGAAVVLSSLDAEALAKAVDQITAAGGRALAVPADVGVYDDMEKVRDRAREAFGGVDTWINNAGIAVYGFLEESPMQEEAELFDKHFLGVRHGCRVAVETMAAAGGTIVNLGSEVSAGSAPLQGVYSAGIEAVRAFSDDLRRGLEEKGLPIAVCLVRPAAVDPLPAGNKFAGAVSVPPPVYAPDVVARAILRCAVFPKPEVYIGGPARLLNLVTTLFPRAAARYQKTFFFRRPSKPKPPRAPRPPAPPPGVFRLPPAWVKTAAASFLSALLWRIFSRRPRP